MLTSEPEDLSFDELFMPLTAGVSPKILATYFIPT